MREWAAYSLEEDGGRHTLVVTGPLLISTIGALDRELRAFDGHVDTIDLSHAAIAHDDVIEMATRLGHRLRHIHLTDGTDSAKDEHLVPGRGTTGADRFLHHLATSGFDGEIVLEINTRKAASKQAREADLRESLAFAREHFRP